MHVVSNWVELFFPKDRLNTAAKLGVYSTYSPRSSLNFLSRCSNFRKPQKIQKFVHPTSSPRQKLPPHGTKNGDFSIVFFQSREQVVVRWDQVRRIGCVIKRVEDQVGQFLLGCRCPASLGIVMQEQNPLLTFLRRFPFKMSFNCTSRDG